MSVVIIVKVSEGLVLGADSASTLQGSVRGPNGNIQQGVLKTFMNARKLLQIGDFPIGVLTLKSIDTERVILRRPPRSQWSRRISEAGELLRMGWVKENQEEKAICDSLFARYIKNLEKRL